MKLDVVVGLLAALLVVSRPAWAHGDSANGVGSAGANTMGGEISEGTSLFVRYDLRVFRTWSEAQLLAYQAAGEGVHQQQREHVVSLGTAFALSPRWDFCAALTLKRVENFADNSDSYSLLHQQVSTAKTIQGLGDTTLWGRYQLIDTGVHHVAMAVGLKLPTGNTRQVTDQGELLGTHNQPGSGSFDFYAGLGYSVLFLKKLVLSSDVLVRFNTEGAAQFRSGNSLQADLALAAKLSPHFTPSIELNGVFQEQDFEQSVLKKNSGVNLILATASARFSIANQSFVLATSLPVWQSFPGISCAETFRLSVAYMVSWGDSTGEHSRTD